MVKLLDKKYHLVTIVTVSILTVLGAGYLGWRMLYGNLQSGDSTELVENIGDIIEEQRQFLPEQAQRIIDSNQPITDENYALISLKIRNHLVALECQELLLVRQRVTENRKTLNFDNVLDAHNMAIACYRLQEDEQNFILEKGALKEYLEAIDTDDSARRLSSLDDDYVFSVSLAEDDRE
jgi:hypothetical protein